MTKLMFETLLMPDTCLAAMTKLGGGILNSN